MFSVAIVSWNGGAGRTTIAANLAADLARIVAGQAQPFAPGMAAAATDTPEPTATADQ